MELTVHSSGSIRSASGLGAVQLFNSVTQVLGEYAADDVQDWDYVLQPDTWYPWNASNDYRYAISRAIKNGNENYPGSVNDNYTARMLESEGIDLIYYYVGFDSLPI